MVFVFLVTKDPKLLGQKIDFFSCYKITEQTFALQLKKHPRFD